ncbi:hypothetical protein [Paraburkholderia mimosarum]|uniref:hypothetical protein n=1 Tax=Paraburkholderia mimosarum TaxID=312026 RepID=UPI0012B52175|nr:hypothetical protein [Paraburkholderia mimosarum]
MNEPYQETRTVADLLDAAGLNDYADQLRSALVEGATGTEIYMILHWRLANMAADAAVAPGLKARLLTLHGYLDRALGP